MSNKLVPRLFKMVDLSEKSEYKISKLRRLLKQSESSTIIRPLINISNVSSLNKDNTLEEEIIEPEEKQFKSRTKKMIKKVKKDK